MHRDTAASVTGVYERLSMTPGPSSRCQKLAAARGWPPPLAWDDESIDDPAATPYFTQASPAGAVDEVAVHRATLGDRVLLTTGEVRAAVQQLTTAGLPAAVIAERLHITSRSVQRHREALSTSARSDVA